MALTRHLIRTIEIPHEPGATITIRKLSHHQLMMAQDTMQDRALERFGRVADVAQKLPQTADDRDRARELAENPENKYDRRTVLRAGITAWTYAEPPDEATIDDLDEDTAEWAFQEIMAFSVRSAAEGKVSASASPPTSDPAEVVGLPS